MKLSDLWPFVLKSRHRREMRELERALEVISEGFLSENEILRQEEIERLDTTVLTLESVRKKFCE